jgi:hypothetical protein
MTLEPQDDYSISSLGPKSIRIDILQMSVCSLKQKLEHFLIFVIAIGGHLGFYALVANAGTFARDMEANYFFKGP